MRMPCGLKPPLPKGLVPPVPIHLLPPSWRSCCSSRRFERLHQLVPAHLFDRGFLFGREFKLQRLLEPVERQLGLEVGQHLDARLEVGGKGAVELVELGFVLDQAGARG